jgi:hypothetical protein
MEMSGAQPPAEVCNHYTASTRHAPPALPARTWCPLTHIYIECRASRCTCCSREHNSCLRRLRQAQSLLQLKQRTCWHNAPMQWTASQSFQGVRLSTKIRHHYICTHEHAVYACEPSDCRPTLHGTVETTSQRRIQWCGCCRNEDKDDLATPDLKYLAVPFLQGELAARGATTDMQACCATYSTTGALALVMLV